MKFEINKEEFEKERKDHEGLTKYKIYKMEDEDKFIYTILETFWEKCDSEAYKKYLSYCSENGVSEDDDVFYGQYYVVMSMSDDGKTYTVRDRLYDESSKEDKEWAEAALKSMKAVHEDTKSDLEYMAKTYDSENHIVHSKSEYWSLDLHMLYDLEFNIPLIIKDKNSVPNEFCIKAAKKLNPDYNENDSYSFSDEVSNLGRKLWEDEMNDLLHHVWTYLYFEDCGLVNENEKWSDDRKKFCEEIEIPYLPGRYNDIDYSKVEKIMNEEWNAIWNWVLKYGRSLWT